MSTVSLRGSQTGRPFAVHHSAVDPGAVLVGRIPIMKRSFATLPSVIAAATYFVVCTDAWISTTIQPQIPELRLSVSAINNPEPTTLDISGNSGLLDHHAAHHASSDAASHHDSLTQDLISKLRFRELKRALETRELPSDGTTSQLRARLRQAALGDVDEECIVNEDGIEDDCQPEVSGVF